MAEKDFNYNITQTFYAKWILPFVLLALGTFLILFFLPGTRFVKGKVMPSKEEKVFYRITVDKGSAKEERFVEIKEKDVYYTRTVGGNEYYYIDTEFEPYTKSIPWYSGIRMNLSVMASAGGVGLSIVGLFMLVINVFKKISKVNPKKIKQIENNNEEDEEDDE